MTSHSHDPAAGAIDPLRRSTATDPPASRPARPRWLLPGLAAAAVGIGLVLAGVVSASTLLYVALFGGMLLMHLGGHGHGGQGAQGGHGTHGGDAGTPGQDLSERSGGSQPDGSGSRPGLDDRASNNQDQSETTEHDQHRSHGCH